MRPNPLLNTKLALWPAMKDFGLNLLMVVLLTYDSHSMIYKNTTSPQDYCQVEATNSTVSSDYCGHDFDSCSNCLRPFSIIYREIDAKKVAYLGRFISGR